MARVSPPIVTYALGGALSLLGVAICKAERTLPEYLVEAEVVSILDSEPGFVNVTMRITHVFCGSKELQDGRVRIVVAKKGQGGTGVVIPLLERGQIGVWPLKAFKGQVVVDWSPPLKIAVPSRKQIEKDYPQARKLAEAIEDYGSTPGHSRMAFLATKARDDTYQVSSWAIQMLGASDVKTSLPFLRSLTGAKGIHVLTQATLDDVLTREDATWQASATRRDLLQSWVTRAYEDPGSAEAVLSELHIRAQRAAIDESALLELMRLAIANDRIPVRARRYAIDVVGLLATRPGAASDQCVECLLSLTASSDPDVAEHAAQTIRHHFSLDATRRERIRKAIPTMSERAAKVIVPMVEQRRQGG